MKKAKCYPKNRQEEKLENQKKNPFFRHTKNNDFT